MKWYTAILAWLKSILEWDVVVLNQPAEIPPPPAPPQPIVVPPVAPQSPYLWDTQADARHSVRVICDEEGLSLNDKEIITACIMQESHFYNTAINHNRDAQGNVLSTDWGIVQVNDHYHIGPGKDFPSVEYVLAYPDKCVRWMCTLFKQGKLGLWVSYSSGAYKQWLPK